MTDLRLVRRLEEACLNALPALRTLHYDGWILRFADGFLRRANSINMLYAGDGTLDLSTKIDTCESIYRACDFPHGVVFKITPLTPPELEPMLLERGYTDDSLTLVQTVDLKQPHPQPRSMWRGDITRPDVPSLEVQISPSLSPEWLEMYFRLNTRMRNLPDLFAKMLNAIQPQTGYTTIIQDGKIIALGLGVIDAGMIGLYDIVVDEAHRRRGIGRVLVSALLNWGIENGAHTAYLQVMDINERAKPLYAGFGFTTVYSYHYIQK